MNECWHVFGKNGICVKPGCMMLQPKGAVETQPHPASTMTAERRAQVVALLATRSNAQIARELHIRDTTVSRIRKEEATKTG